MHDRGRRSERPWAAVWGDRGRPSGATVNFRMHDRGRRSERPWASVWGDRGRPSGATVGALPDDGLNRCPLLCTGQKQQTAWWSAVRRAHPAKTSSTEQRRAADAAARQRQAPRGLRLISAPSRAERAAADISNESAPIERAWLRVGRWELKRQILTWLRGPNTKASTIMLKRLFLNSHG